MEWQEVIARDDIIGGDIETQESGDVYRGPLKSIRLDENGIVHFECDWMAVMKGWRGKWRKWNRTSSSINGIMCKPQDNGGRIRATVPTMGPIVIFPRGDTQLDPANVEGLNL